MKRNTGAAWNSKATDLYQAQFSQARSGNWFARQGRENPLATRLAKFAHLGIYENEALNRICSNVRKLTSAYTLIAEAQRPRCVHVIVSGFACRYKHLIDGRRQICGYLLPGDLSDPHFAVRTVSDHSVGLLSDAHVAMVSATELMAVMVAFPKIERALHLARLAEEATLREWILNVGQRNALQKHASFFCEMAERLDRIGAANANGSYDVPLTQIELADTLGLTQGHVNRILQHLRRDCVVTWGRGRFNILDPVRLCAIAGYDGAYLRFAFAPAEFDPPSVASCAPFPCRALDASHIAQAHHATSKVPIAASAM